MVGRVFNKWGRESRGQSQLLRRGWTNLILFSAAPSAIMVAVLSAECKFCDMNSVDMRLLYFFSFLLRCSFHIRLNLGPVVNMYVIYFSPSDMKNLIGEAVCGICQESYSTTITGEVEQP